MSHSENGLFEVGSESEERALLVGCTLRGQSETETHDLLNELEELVATAGATTVGRVSQKRGRPDGAYYVGKGKVEEIQAVAVATDANLVVFDDELSPRQLRNVEDAAGIRVIDRTQVILDIFARRAGSREAKLQVELAQLNYSLPRLVGLGKALSRLAGGIGTRGPGETKLETDRRRIRQRIADIKGSLDEVKKHRQLQRSGRQQVPVVALVGYTNAGKSTLLNKLTGSTLFVEDRVFATLDPSTRRFELPNNQGILVTDTVGFIRKLPHHLVAAFRATLEEARFADVLVHVIDGTAMGRVAQQMAAVDDALRGLGVTEKPTILALNKVDALSQEERAEAADNVAGAIAISAETGYGLDTLMGALELELAGLRVEMDLEIPYHRADLLSLVHDHGQVLSQRYETSGVQIRVRLAKALAGKVKSELVDRP